MSTFRVDNNNVSKNITLEQLTAGLDEVKDKKKIERITLIFEQYNTNKNGTSLDALDIDEQVALMNDLHRADGDGKGKDFDGKVSAKGLKKAGLAGEYKAYRDFVEVYQKAIASDNNTFELTFNDDTLDGELIVETTAKRKGTIDGEEFTEQHQYINNDKAKLIYQTADGTFSYDPKKRLTRQTTTDNLTIMYKAYTSDAKNATAGVIVVRDKDNNRTELQLQDDGTYLNKADNTLYKLNNKGIPEKYTLPELPKEEEALQAAEQAEQQIEKPTRPTARKLVPMTAGWKNQKVKPDADTIAKFNALSKAEEVLAELLKDKGSDFSENLLADLIKNNPSVFNSEGVIYIDAKWDKLDFPNDLSKYQVN